MTSLANKHKNYFFMAMVQVHCKNGIILVLQEKNPIKKVLNNLKITSQWLEFVFFFCKFKVNFFKRLTYFLGACFCSVNVVTEKHWCRHSYKSISKALGFQETTVSTINRWQTAPNLPRMNEMLLSKLQSSQWFQWKHLSNRQCQYRRMQNRTSKNICLYLLFLIDFFPFSFQTVWSLFGP